MTIWKTMTISLAMMSSVANAASIRDPSTDVPILSTKRWISIKGAIDDGMARSVLIRAKKIAPMTGDVLVIIDSDGGYGMPGSSIIKLLRTLIRPGEKMVCAVEGHAMSMGFNILTHCDERYGTEDSQYLFHDLAFVPMFLIAMQKRLTPTVVRKLLVDLDKGNEYYSEKNSAAMSMNRKEYDAVSHADGTVWNTDQLLKKGYLKQVVTVEE